MGLSPVRSRLLSPLRHGFFTRQGGISGGRFASLNCSRSSADLPGNCAENRRRIAEWLGVESEHLLTCTQRHTTDIEVVAELPFRGHPIADGLVTSLPGVAIGVLTADCQPILLADRHAGIIGAVHAGWSGTLGGVIENAVTCMESSGADRSRIIAVIGPAISHRNYEVQVDFRQRFLEADPASGQFFRQEPDGRLTLDLPAYGRSRLEKSGISSIADSGLCTYADPARFFSCRRSHHCGEDGFGLMLSAIRLG